MRAEAKGKEEKRAEHQKCCCDKTIDRIRM